MLDEIVFIDDDKIISAANKRVVQSILPNVAVKTFANGEEGLVYLLSAKDLNLRTLVFLDLTMPIMDGFQFLNIYENAIAYQDHSFVICLLTGSLDEQDEKKAARYPSVLKYTQKPLDKKRIENLIKEAANILNQRESY